MQISLTGPLTEGPSFLGVDNPKASPWKPFLVVPGCSGTHSGQPIGAIKNKPRTALGSKFDPIHLLIL
jgi:hypothetical protein